MTILMAAAGGGSTQIILSDQIVTDSGPGTAFASYALSGGDVYTATAWNGGGVIESSVRPTAAYTLFEAKAELDSGTTPDGSALSNYFDLNTDSPSWSLPQSGSGNDTSVLLVTMREKLNTSNNKTVTVTLEVEVP